MKAARTPTPTTRASEERLMGNLDLFAVVDVKAALLPRPQAVKKSNVLAHAVAAPATAGVGKYVWGPAPGSKVLISDVSDHFAVTDWLTGVLTLILPQA